MSIHIEFNLTDDFTYEEVEALLMCGLRYIKKTTGPQNAENTKHMRRLAGIMMTQLNTQKHDHGRLSVRSKTEGKARKDSVQDSVPKPKDGT